MNRWWTTTWVVMLGGLTVSLVTAYLGIRADQGYRGVYWLIWPAMVLHQCEELVVTDMVRKQKFAFIVWARSLGYALTPRLALGLNVGVGWTLAIAASMLGPRVPFLPLFVIGVEAINGFWHLSITAHRQRWSPGTLTGVCLAVPLAFAIYKLTLDHGLASPSGCFLTFIAAAASHHLFLRSLPRA